MTLRIAVALVAGFVAILGTLVVDFMMDSTFAQVLVLSVAILALMVIAVLIRPDKRVPFIADPILLICVFLVQFFVIAPVLVHFYGFTPILFFTPPADATMVKTLQAFFLMMLMCVVGYHARFGATLAQFIPAFGSSPRKLPGYWAELLVLAGSVTACLYWIQINGGIIQKLSTGYGSRNNPALFTISHVSLLVGTLLMAWRLLNVPKRGKMQTLLFGAVIGFDVLFYGFLLGARKYLLFLFFGMLAMWLFRKGQNTLPKFRIGVVVVLLLAYFTVWGSIRGKPITALLGLSSDVRYVQNTGLGRGYFTAVEGPFGGACKVLEIFPDQEPFKHGQTLAIVFLGFIPRAIWPEKPVGIGKEITRYYEGPLYKHTSGLSVAPTVLGAFWVNFGWVGVVAGGFLLGVICRTVCVYAVTGMRNRLQYQAARVLIPAVFVAGLGELRADLAAMLLTWGLMLAPLLVALAFFNLHSGDAVESPTPLAGRLEPQGLRSSP